MCTVLYVVHASHSMGHPQLHACYSYVYNNMGLCKPSKRVELNLLYLSEKNNNMPLLKVFTGYKCKLLYIPPRAYNGKRGGVFYSL